MIYFHNQGEAPIEALVTLGVSVKAEGAIGWFGTGFKYAIATLLRTGHKVWLNDREFSFREATIRGESFNIVTFEGKDLGFTTQLGRNWEVWQAFRELHSNALDEGGGSTRSAPSAETVIAVRGDGIESAFDHRNEIFLATQPILTDDAIEIHAEPSSRLYYRNVRAGDAPRPTQYTYNLLQTTQLTEDRTIASQFQFFYLAGRALCLCEDEELIERCVVAPEGSFEEMFMFDNHNVSDTFLAVVKRNLSNSRLNNSARETYKKLVGADAAEPEAITLTEGENAVLAQAMRLCEKLGAAPENVTFCETLGNNTMGLMRSGRIYIARDTVAQGYRVLASTLYEEWLHQRHRLDDCSREMQNYLFNKLIAEVDK